MRLSQGEGADLLALSQRWQKTTLLFLASEPQDRRATNRVVHAHDGRAGTVTGGNFFQRQGVGQIAGITPAPLLWHKHAEKTQLPHLGQRLGREAVLPRSDEPRGGK